MRFVGVAFEFGMVLDADEEGMILELYGLHESAVRREAAQEKTAFGDDLAVVNVKLVAMAVALAYCLHAVTAFHQRATLDHAWVSAEAHRAALIDIVALAGHEIDNLIICQSSP